MVIFSVSTEHWIIKESLQQHLKRVKWNGALKKWWKEYAKAKKGTLFIMYDHLRLSCRRLLVLAGDINPIDIISHLPVLSEEAGIPYVFVASKEELGHASSTKRPTSCVMICPNQKRKTKLKEGEKKDEEEDYRELYDECYQEVEKLDTKIVF